VKALIIVSFGVFCICLLSACGGNSSAAVALPTPTRTSTPLPTPVPTPTLRPSLELEGQGSLMASGPCSGSSSAGVFFCPGVFSGTVSGSPLGTLDLTFDVLTVLRTSIGGVFVDEIGCTPATGSGQLNGGQLSLVFSGTFCGPGPSPDPGGRFGASPTFTLRGSVQIHTTQLCPASGQWTAMSGTLDAFGEMHTSGPSPTPTPAPAPVPVNPFPSGPNHAIISLIGAANQLPAPCPSP